jgi:hypothetical protein
MAIPERARALPKFSVLGLGEPFIANLCGKWLGLRLNGCCAALADIGLPRRLPAIGQWQTLTAGWQRADSGYQLAP